MGGKIMKERGSSLLGAGLVMPWCCVAPAMLSLVGLTGLSLGTFTRVEADLFPYLAAMAVLLLGRAHYLFYAKRQGNRLSRIITWSSTGLVATLLTVRLWI